MGTATTRNEPFGWLILGLAVGVIVGHAIAYSVAIPPGYTFRYVERLAFVLVACAVHGVGIGAVAERRLQRHCPIGVAWVIWCLGAIAYFLGYGLPMMNAARE